MYTVVVMMALSSGAEMPACWRSRHCGAPCYPVYYAPCYPVYPAAPVVTYPVVNQGNPGPSPSPVTMTEEERRQLAEIVQLLYKDDAAKRAKFEQAWGLMTPEQRRETWNDLQQSIRKAKERPDDKKTGASGNTPDGGMSQNASPAILRVSLPRMPV